MSSTDTQGPTDDAIRDALKSQPWTPEHCRNYPRRASEEIEFLREALQLMRAAPVPAEPVAPDLKDVWLTAPKRVWLDLGEPDMRELDVFTGMNFRDLQEVTWSEDNATGWGIPYVRADLAHGIATTAQSGDKPWTEMRKCRHCSKYFCDARSAKDHEAACPGHRAKGDA